MRNILAGANLPLNGKRTLSANEAAARARALACIRSNLSECSGQMHVGIFFDGTGNNMDWKESGTNLSQSNRNKHSNVARLFEAHLGKRKLGFFRYYIPGVGTPFDKIGDTNRPLTENIGAAAGYMGADRINWGITSIFNAMHIFLTSLPLISEAEQRRIVNRVSVDHSPLPDVSFESAERWIQLKALEEKLQSVLAGHPKKIVQVNVSIFGFSRGAAEARTCANWLGQIVQKSDGSRRLAGTPIRIAFMGLFDTVAAVGIGDVTPLTSGHMAWAEGTQGIHPMVEECVHYVALHEQRASFPLEASTDRGCVGYPGMHSDVGGGYCPKEQGKAQQHSAELARLSQVPLLDMHFAAIKAGVAMRTIEEIRALPEIAPDFETDQQLVSAYNGWLRSHGIRPSQLDAYTRAHVDQLLQWRGSMHVDKRQSLASKAFFRRANAGDRKDLAEADDDLGLMLRFWRARKQANATAFGRATELSRSIVSALPGTGLFLEPGKDPLSEHEEHFLSVMTSGAVVPVECALLFEEYVHDSRAGFRVGGFHEPKFLTGGYARYRNIFTNMGKESWFYCWANEALDKILAAPDAAVAYFQFLQTMSRNAYQRARRTRAATAQEMDDLAIAYANVERNIVMKYVEAEKELARQMR